MALPRPDQDQASGSQGKNLNVGGTISFTAPTNEADQSLSPNARLETVDIGGLTPTEATQARAAFAVCGNGACGGCDGCGAADMASSTNDSPELVAAEQKKTQEEVHATSDLANTAMQDMASMDFGMDFGEATSAAAEAPKPDPSPTQNLETQKLNPNEVRSESVRKEASSYALGGTYQKSAEQGASQNSARTDAKAERTITEKATRTEKPSYDKPSPEKTPSRETAKQNPEKSAEPKSMLERRAEVVAARIDKAIAAAQLISINPKPGNSPATVPASSIKISNSLEKVVASALKCELTSTTQVARLIREVQTVRAQFRTPPPTSAIHLLNLKVARSSVTALQNALSTRQSAMVKSPAQLARVAKVRLLAGKSRDFKAALKRGQKRSARRGVKQHEKIQKEKSNSKEIKARSRKNTSSQRLSQGNHKLRTLQRLNAARRARIGQTLRDMRDKINKWRESRKQGTTKRIAQNRTQNLKHNDRSRNSRKVADAIIRRSDLRRTHAIRKRTEKTLVRIKREASTKASLRSNRNQRIASATKILLRRLTRHPEIKKSFIRKAKEQKKNLKIGGKESSPRTRKNSAPRPTDKLSRLRSDDNLRSLNLKKNATRKSVGEEHDEIMNLRLSPIELRLVTKALSAKTGVKLTASDVKRLLKNKKLKSAAPQKQVENQQDSMKKATAQAGNAASTEQGREKSVDHKGPAKTLDLDVFRIDDENKKKLQELSIAG